MSTNTHLRLLEFLKTSFDPDGTIHFLAVSATELSRSEAHLSIYFKVRVALTYREGDSINPYFDGTDLSIVITPDDVQFTNEDEWADGPPAREGSPIELALGWASELGPPIWISPKAQEAANAGITEIPSSSTLPLNSDDWI